MKISEFWRACRRLGPGAAQARLTTHMACRDGSPNTVQSTAIFFPRRKFGFIFRFDNLEFVASDWENDHTYHPGRLIESKIEEIRSKSAFSLEGKMMIFGPDKPVN